MSGPNYPAELFNQTNLLYKEAVNPCAFESSLNHQLTQCGHESTRIGTDGKRYCELHYNKLKSIQHNPKK